MPISYMTTGLLIVSVVTNLTVERNQHQVFI